MGFLPAEGSPGPRGLPAEASGDDVPHVPKRSRPPQSGESAAARNAVGSLPLDCPKEVTNASREDADASGARDSGGWDRAAGGASGGGAFLIVGAEHRHERRGAGRADLQHAQQQARTSPPIEPNFGKSIAHKRKHVTPSIIWEEIQQNPERYRYSRFCEGIGQADRSLTMRQGHAGGDKSFVDSVLVVDRLTPQARQAQIFVAVMAASYPQILIMCFRAPFRKNMIVRREMLT